MLEGDRILHVGPRFDGRVDETVDARDRVVTPGLISSHAHIGGSPLDRSFIEDRGSPQFWYSGLDYNATAEDIDRVYVDGRVVVDRGSVLAADEAKILAALQGGGERMWPRMGRFDWAGRGADELSPQTYPEWT